MANCENCGAPLHENEHFCAACGTVSDPSSPASKNPADRKPPKGSPYAVLGSWSFVGTMLLMCIPVVGFILTIVWACGGAHNQNRRNYARSVLLLYAILIVIYLLLVFVVGVSFDSLSTIMTY